MRRAVIHIGAIKTGSTTIQRALAGHRADLLAAGVAYAQAPGAENHLALAVHAVPDAVRDLWQHVAMDGDTDAFRARLEAALASEIAALPPAVRTVIFSNEHCQAKIERREEVERLRALLAPHFAEFRIVLYIRRQDQLVVSAYNEHLKDGGADRDVFARLREEWLSSLDYAARLALWAEVFGRESVTVRLFSREDFVGGDLLTDFCTAAGIAPLRPTALRLPVQNASLRADAQRVLRWCNDRFGAPAPTDGWAGRMRRRLLHRLRRDVTGTGCMPSQARARAFLRHFDEANERLRAAWFPTRQAVFDDDVSRYPVEERATPLWRDLLTVAAAMVAAPARARRAALARRVARWRPGSAATSQPARNPSSAARTASGASSAR
jgi:hypothetical protein